MNLKNKEALFSFVVLAAVLLNPLSCFADKEKAPKKRNSIVGFLETPGGQEFAWFSAKQNKAKKISEDPSRATGEIWLSIKDYGTIGNDVEFKFNVYCLATWSDGDKEAAVLSGFLDPSTPDLSPVYPVNWIRLQIAGFVGRRLYDRGLIEIAPDHDPSNPMPCGPPPAGALFSPDANGEYTQGFVKISYRAAE